MIRPAVFLDRDGVLNAMVLNPATRRLEAPLASSDFRLIDGVIPALLHLQDAGYPLILVSNQPNFALGKSSYEAFRSIHQEFVTRMAAAGIQFLRFGYCLHHPKGLTPGYSQICECRKPSPGLLLQAADDFSLTLAESWMIGDQPTDTQCGRAAGTRTIRVIEPESRFDAGRCGPDPCADYIARDLAEAAEIILDRSAGRLSAGLRSCQTAGIDHVTHSPRVVMKHLHGLQRVLL